MGVPGASASRSGRPPSLRLGFGLGPYVYGTFYPLDAAAQTVVVNNQQTVYGPSPATYPAAAPVVERIKVIIYRPAGCDSQTDRAVEGRRSADQILRC